MFLIHCLYDIYLKNTKGTELLVSIAIFVRNITDSSLDIWTQIRNEDGPLNGLLEFPGGKIEVKELPLEACIREVEEEVGFTPKTLQEFKIQAYQYNDRHVCLHVFFSNVTIDHEEFKKGKWITIDKEKKSRPYKGQIPEVNHLIIDDLVDYLLEQNAAGVLEEVWKN